MEPKIEVNAKDGVLHLITSKGVDAVRMQDESYQVDIGSITALIEGRSYDPAQSIAIICRDGSVKIRLNLESTETDFVTNAHGKARLSPELEGFQANGASWDIDSLARHCRFNPHLFPSSGEAQALFMNLSKVKIERKKEREQDTKGNASAKIVTKTSLPNTIKVLVPLFAGDNPLPLTFEVDLSPSDDRISLVCPELNRIISERLSSAHAEIVKCCEESAIPLVYE